MRYLITILFVLFFIDASCQFAAGMAQYTSECAIKFGVLVNGTLSNASKANVLKDSLGCLWNRGELTVQTWTGSNSRYEAYNNKSVLQLPVLQYYSSSSVTPFVTSAQVAGFKDTIALMCAKYPNIYGFVVENEPINQLNFFGSLADYINNELKPAWEVAHPLGIKVYDGGTYGDGIRISVYRFLQAKSGYGQSVADQFGSACMGSAEINAAQNPGSNPSMETRVKQIDTIFSMGAPYVDAFNIHIYEPVGVTTQPDTVTQCAVNFIRYIQEYVRATTKRECITNETVARDNTQVALVQNMVAEYYRLGFPIMQWFNGDGSSGAQPLTNQTTGVKLPTGIAFYNYIITHQGNIYFTP